MPGTCSPPLSFCRTAQWVGRPGNVGLGFRVYLCERSSSARRCSMMNVTAFSVLPWQKRSPRLACASAYPGQLFECHGHLPCPAQQVSARRRKAEIAWPAAKAVRVLLPIWSLSS